MVLEKQKFTDYGKEKADVFPVRLNVEERKELDQVKMFIKQPKDSTAVKQLVKIGIAVVIHDKKTKALLEIILNNARRNNRTGVADLEYL